MAGGRALTDGPGDGGCGVWVRCPPTLRDVGGFALVSCRERDTPATPSVGGPRGRRRGELSSSATPRPRLSGNSKRNDCPDRCPTASARVCPAGTVGAPRTAL